MNIAIDPNTSTPYVFVLKKNKTALENLRDWLKSQQLGDAQIDIPMLVVDDESDYASVNTKDDDSPTVINSLIRSILGTVSKSSYLAFTATPFANVFIDHETTQELLGDDLFPRDYIRTIDAPSNYVGSTDLLRDRGGCRRNRSWWCSTDADDYFPLKHKSRPRGPGASGHSGRRDPDLRRVRSRSARHGAIPVPARCSSMSRDSRTCKRRFTGWSRQSSRGSRTRSSCTPSRCSLATARRDRGPAGDFREAVSDVQESHGTRWFPC